MLLHSLLMIPECAVYTSPQIDHIAIKKLDRSKTAFIKFKSHEFANKAQLALHNSEVAAALLS